MKEKILIIEDERDIARLVDYNLKKEGYRTFVTHDGPSGLACAVRERPDLIVLDLMLPGMDGMEICRRLKNGPDTSCAAILMLTAKADETDKVVGLEMGADDYMGKPFSVKELLARIRAILRRLPGRCAAQGTYRAGGLEIDFEKILVTVKGRPADLSAREYELLKALVLARGRVIGRTDLLEMVWGFAEAAEIQTRTVDVHVMTLRKKLKREGARIITVKNYGYRFEAGAGR